MRPQRARLRPCEITGVRNAEGQSPGRRPPGAGRRSAGVSFRGDEHVWDADRVGDTVDVLNATESGDWKQVTSWQVTLP